MKHPEQEVDRVLLKFYRQGKIAWKWDMRAQGSRWKLIKFVKPGDEYSVYPDPLPDEIQEDG